MRLNPFASRNFHLALTVALLLVSFGSQALAGIPAGYYDAVDSTTQASLRNTLHMVIDDHTRIPYTASSWDTWNVLELADQDPNDSSRVLDVYLNASYQKWSAGNTDYNREHSWPKSFGFPDDGSGNYPYTDCHQLFICNDSRNSSRSNKPYGSVGGSGTAEYVTEVNNGVGGGSGVYPGWSNWASTVYWETWLDRRGDVARAQLYMDVRYEGGNHGVTGVWEPDLILTDNLAQIEASNTGNNEAVAYMGLLSVLLQWHLDDPVDAREMNRNDMVYASQGNRNPFVDHPEWVDCLFTGVCAGETDETPPAAPLGLMATAGDGSVDLDWNDNSESDLAGYNVYRSTSLGGPYNMASLGLVVPSQYTDTDLINDTTYYYVVTASDLSINESLASNEACATPVVGSGIGPVVWINEIHYDNVSTDTGEFFEVAGPAGMSLAGWTLVGYNGNGGAVYNTINLTGSLPDQQNGYGTLSFNMLGMQNGSPDGLALVDDGGVVIEFISYEGVVNATTGIASGTTSTDVGVSETASTPIGHSLQLAGTGSTSWDFVWQGPQAHTSGLPNVGQTFEAPVTNQLPIAVANGTYAADMNVNIVFSAAGSIDPDGTISSWAWNFGDGASSSLANPDHAYATAGVFAVILTVTDNMGGVAADTTSATIVDPAAAVTPSMVAGARIAGIYPNPFNPATNIRFSVGEPGPVRVEIFSVKGELVRVLLNEDRAAGEFLLRWNGTSDNGQTVPSGAYFCRVRNKAGADTQSMLLLK